MTLALLAALPLLAAPSTGSKLPLPGYAADGFPSARRLLGPAEDPLAALTAEAAGEDLRDAVAAAPSVLWLQAGLRAPRPRDRAEAAVASGLPGNRAAVPHLAGVLLRLDEAVEVRVAAAISLGRVGTEESLRPLVAALRDPAAEVRHAAALALGRLGRDGSATALARALKDDEWYVRHAAVVALARLKRPFAVSSLEEVLERDARWQVRLQAVRSLQEIGTPRAVDAAAAALGDRDSGVRAAAALALRHAGSRRHAPLLRSALERELDASVSAVLRKALADLN